jgi:sugar phosphate isomerase/epimerase
MFERPQLSLSLAGLARDPAAPWAAGARAAIAWAADTGYRSVQLDAAAPGLRPRELDRSGRRDLAAFLRRSQLTLSGFDLWIPPEHFADPARSDRAMEAALAAIELAAAVGGLVDGSPSPTLSLSLPENLGSEATALLIARAEATGARIADHTLRTQEQPPLDPESPLGIGVDPASLLLAGRDPAAAVSRAGRLLVTARLSDATVVGRIAPGSPGGRLDQLSYIVALSTVAFSRPLVVDLRGLAEQHATAADIRSRWEQ